MTYKQFVSDMLVVGYHFHQVYYKLDRVEFIFQLFIRQFVIIYFI